LVRNWVEMIHWFAHWPSCERRSPAADTISAPTRSQHLLPLRPRRSEERPRGFASLGQRERRYFGRWHGCWFRNLRLRPLIAVTLHCRANAQPRLAHAIRRQRPTASRLDTKL